MMQKKWGLTVLAAEDNEFNAAFIMAAFGGLGINVDLVGNGIEAVAMTKRKRYDMIFLDCHMPEMDGYAAARAIRELGGCFMYIPIIAISATITCDVRIACLSAGMNDVLHKPIEIEELELLLERFSSCIEPELTNAQPAGEAANSLFSQAVRLLCSEMSLTYEEADGLLCNFIKITREKIDGLEASCRLERWKETVEFAHQIKGMASNMRQYRIQEVACRMEHNPEDALNGIGELRQLLQALG